MPIEVDPKAEEAAELAKANRLIVNISPMGRTPGEILKIAQEIRDAHGDQVFEVLDRDDDPKKTIEAIRLIAGENMAVLLGSVKTTRQLQKAFDADAVGYVSQTNRDDHLKASIHAKGGAKIAFPTTSSSESFGSAFALRLEEMGLERAHELPLAQQGVKIFPHTPDHPVQPDPTDPEQPNYYTQRLLAPSVISNGDINAHLLFTGYGISEQARSVLSINHVGEKPLTTMIGPAVSTPDELAPWLEEIEHAK